MNRDEPKEIDQQCNVCGSNIEVGSAWSQCSNRNCPTRGRDVSLDTDADGTEITQYYKEQMGELQSQLDAGLSEQAIKDAALAAFEKYVTADDRVAAEEAEIRANTYLEHVDTGWGWLKEKSGAI
jgi:hypothetical protein